MLSQSLTRTRFLLWRLRDMVLHLVRGRAHRQEVFTRIYTLNLWRDRESRSGTGSSLAATRSIRASLPGLFRKYGVRSVVDAPCGDFGWMRQLVSELDLYIGIDIVPELITVLERNESSEKVRFLWSDLSSEPLPVADLILCRDCLIHLPTKSIQQALQNFRSSGARYLLLTNHIGAPAYRDIPVGSFRPIDFTQPPFNFPPPEETLKEDGEDGRKLCLWRIETLPI